MWCLPAYSVPPDDTGLHSGLMVSADPSTTRLYQSLALLRLRGFEVGQTARCNGTPRIAIDGVLKTCEQIIEMADNLRKPPSS